MHKFNDVGKQFKVTHISAIFCPIYLVDAIIIVYMFATSIIVMSKQLEVLMLYLHGKL